MKGEKFILKKALFNDLPLGAVHLNPKWLPQIKISHFNIDYQDNSAI